LATLTVGDITASEQIDITDDSLLAGQKLNDMKSARAFLAALGKPVTDKTFKDVALAAAFENSTIPFEKNTVDFKAGVNALFSVARRGLAIAITTKKKASSADCWTDCGQSPRMANSLARCWPRR
jgi:hypothetical protein